MADILVAKQSFVTMHKGVRVYVRAGETVHPDHWLVAALPDKFRPQTIKHDVPTPAPRPAASTPRPSRTS